MLFLSFCAVETFTAGCVEYSRGRYGVFRKRTFSYEKRAGPLYLSARHRAQWHVKELDTALDSGRRTAGNRRQNEDTLKRELPRYARRHQLALRRLSFNRDPTGNAWSKRSPLGRG
jgi:hypothetical protein